LRRSPLKPPEAGEGGAGVTPGVDQFAIAGLDPYEGKDEVAALHRDIFAVLDDIDTTEPLALGDTGSFSFRARVRGVELEAMNLVRVNEQGQIVELTVFVRPLPGLATLFATLPPRVSARRRGRLKGTLVAILARPLAFTLCIADRLTPRFL
jgi:hypothetical protein